MKLSKETLKRIIKEELEESRLRRHRAQKKAGPKNSPRDIQKIIDHPFMEYYLKAYFGTLTHEDWDNQPEGVGGSRDINEREFFNLIQSKLADGNRELALAVVGQMMADGTLDEEFLLAAGIN